MGRCPSPVNRSKTVTTPPPTPEVNDKEEEILTQTYSEIKTSEGTSDTKKGTKSEIKRSRTRLEIPASIEAKTCFIGVQAIRKRLQEAFLSTIEDIIYLVFAYNDSNIDRKTILDWVSAIFDEDIDSVSNLIQNLPCNE